jgi:hypothetical protein
MILILPEKRTVSIAMFKQWTWVNCNSHDRNDNNKILTANYKTDPEEHQYGCIWCVAFIIVFIAVLYNWSL